VNPALALLTQHGKLAAVEGPLREAGFATFLVDGFNTDLLGTFTGEVARAGSQLDAAMAKARKATEIAMVRFGLGSEGSFGPDPYIGLNPWGCEVLAWWDAQAGYGVHAVQQGPQTNYAQTTVHTLDAALQFCTAIGFPGHGVIVGKPGQAIFSKELATPDAAMRTQLQAALAHGPLWLETDMRAHRNPTRMAMIAQCASALSAQLRCPCPGCARPGFGLQTALHGAVCSGCGRATDTVRAVRTSCAVCGFSQEKRVRDTVEPARCGYCNP